MSKKAFLIGAPVAALFAVLAIGAAATQSTPKAAMAPAACECCVDCGCAACDCAAGASCCIDKTCCDDGCCAAGCCSGGGCCG